MEEKGRAAAAKLPSKGVATVAIRNTPQAKDESYALGENGRALVKPLENDLGGAAKHLWSIHQADLSVHTMNCASILLDGGTLKVTVVGDQLLLEVVGSGYDHLALGQSEEVTFSYAIRMADAAIATSEITITITGTNDGPVLAPDTAEHLLCELPGQTGSAEIRA